MNDWKKSYATHLEEQELATGEWPGDKFPGIALPCTEALKRWVIVRFGDRFTCAQVVDVGPWCIDDRAYVFGDQKPRAEQTQGMRCPRTLFDSTFATVPGNKNPLICNGASLDMMPRVARELGITVGSNAEVSWKFVEV